MKRRQPEKVTTYISTLTVNFGNNQSTKSKPHSKSHNLPSREHGRSSTSQYHSDATQSYRDAQKKGTYYHLIPSTPSTRSKEPEQKKGKERSSFHSSKAYFEELSTPGARGGARSWSKSYDNRDENQPKNEYLKEREYDKPSLSTPSREKPEMDKPSPPVTEKWTLDEPKTKYSANSSASSVTKQSTSNRVSKEMTTTIKTTTRTTTIEETQTLLSKKAEVTSVKPATDYGETDWYLDILLRMQSLEMKQQTLQTEYDFLGKRAKENREDLRLSRDWARYNADICEVEAY